MEQQTLDAHRDRIKRFLRSANRGKIDKVQKHQAYNSASAICIHKYWAVAQDMIDLDDIVRRTAR